MRFKSLAYKNRYNGLIMLLTLNENLSQYVTNLTLSKAVRTPFHNWKATHKPKSRLPWEICWPSPCVFRELGHGGRCPNSWGGIPGRRGELASVWRLTKTEIRTKNYEQNRQKRVTACDQGAEGKNVRSCVKVAPENVNIMINAEN